MAERWGRAALVACLLLAGAPSRASADWFITPFFGWDLAGNTTLVDFEYRGAKRNKVTFGGSAMFIKGIFGIEADYAFVPRFFQNPNPGDDPLNPNPPVGPTLVDSHVQTITGNFVLAAPLSWTQESLRPYLVAGVGWMDAAAEDAANSFPVNANLTALDIGAGAIGMLGNRAGLRFDVRRFTNIDRDTPSGTSFGTARLHFWRATVGVTLRY